MARSMPATDSVILDDHDQGGESEKPALLLKSNSSFLIMEGHSQWLTSQRHRVVTDSSCRVRLISWLVFCISFAEFRPQPQKLTCLCSYGFPGVLIHD
jgi:hypothetical protein